MELTKEQERLKANMGPIEAQEINLAYTMAYAMWFILNDARWRLNHDFAQLDKKRKKAFAELKVYIDKAKGAADVLFDDYYKCWGSDVVKFDQEQVCANTIARLMLLWQDRIGGYDDRDEAVQKLMESYPECHIGEEVLKKFYMKTFEGVDDSIKKIL